MSIKKSKSILMQSKKFEIGGYFEYNQLNEVFMFKQADDIKAEKEPCLNHFWMDLKKFRE